MNQNSIEDYQFPVGEVDVPLKEEEEEIPVAFIPPHEADNIEKQMKVYKVIEKTAFKRYGLFMIIGCLSAYFLIVVVSSILENVFEWQVSTLTTSFVELLKFLVSTLIGYVFSETIKSKDE